MTLPPYPGARWWKVDFHAHSPHSFDFGGLEEQETHSEVSVEEWILTYMRAGIDGIVITDHNEHRGITEARAELEKLRESKHADFRDLVIFPGVEITTEGGYHLLAVFDPSDSDEKVNRLIHLSGYEGRRGWSTTNTTKSFYDVCAVIAQEKALAIPAHANDARGILKADPRTLELICDSGTVIAAELTSSTLSTEAAKTGWVPVLGSDAHHLDDTDCPPDKIAKYPGSHFTWMKMQNLNLDGLRLALADGTDSTKRSIDVTADPNDVDHHRLDRLVLRNGGAELEVPFSPWLNSLIGGRGVGKSSLVEIIRLGLDRFHELTGEFSKELDWFSPKKIRPTDERFWGPDTEIEIYYSKTGESYRALWRGNNPSTTSIEFLTPSGWQPQDGSVRDRFPVLIYSQKQIYETARNPQALLSIIDAQPDLCHAEWDDKFKLLKSEYAELLQRIAAQSVLIDSEARLKGELADVEVAFQVAKSRRDSESARELDSLVLEEEAHQSIEREAYGFESRLSQSVGELSTLLDATQGAHDSWGPAELRRASVESAIRDVLVAATTLEASRQELREAGPSPRQERIAQLRRELGEDITGSVAGESSIHIQTQFERLSRSRDGLLERLEGVQAAKEACKTLRVEADSVLESVQAHRKDLTNRRKNFIESLNLDPATLKLEIFEMADQSEIEARLREFTQRPTKFDSFFSGPDGAHKVLANDPKNPKYLKDLDRLKSFLKEVRQIGSDASSIFRHNVSLDGRLATHMMTLDEASFNIDVDLWFPDDLLRVRYRSNGEKDLRGLEQGSPGQKTATLLSVILRMSSDPLILDQPEDDLDNALITDLIVNNLKEIKSRRQVIVVTHNANVVVNADSELVTCLHYGETPTVAHQGSIQATDVRDAICRIMEGGEKAFASRYQRLLANA